MVSVSVCVCDLEKFYRIKKDSRHFSTLFYGNCAWTWARNTWMVTRILNEVEYRFYATPKFDSEWMREIDRESERERGGGWERKHNAAAAAWVNTEKKSLCERNCFGWPNEWNIKLLRFRANVQQQRQKINNVDDDDNILCTMHQTLTDIRVE